MTRFHATSEGEIPFTEEEEAEWANQELAREANAKNRANAEIKHYRKLAYKEEADPLFFKSQRGEITVQQWQDKVVEIKTRFPYQE